MDTPTPAPETTKAEAGLKLNSFEFKTDGTLKGTTVSLNGKAIANLASMSLYHYPSSTYSQGLEISYTVRDPKVNPGEFASYTSYTFRPPSLNPGSPCCATRATASVGGGPAVEMEVVTKQFHYDPLSPDNDQRRKLYAEAF